MVTEKNIFLGPALNNIGLAQDPSVCPNGFVHFSDLTGGWVSTADVFDNIGTKTGGNPFGTATGTIGVTHPDQQSDQLSLQHHRRVSPIATLFPLRQQHRFADLFYRQGGIAPATIFPNALAVVVPYVDNCSVANNATLRSPSTTPSPAT